MRKDKVRAYQLRREGKSYKEIKKTLGIPLGTIAGWFKDEEWSQKIRDKLGAQASLAFPEKMAAIQKANKARWTKKYKEYRLTAESQFSNIEMTPSLYPGLCSFGAKGINLQKIAPLDSPIATQP